MLLGMLIAIFIIMCICIAVSWFYGIFLLRLASPEYRLILFTIDEHYKEVYQNKIMRQIFTF